MYFFIDESGDFALSQDDDEHKAAVVTCVTMANCTYRSIKTKYEDYINGLSKFEFQNGEPKGRLLTRESQIAFCEMINGESGLLVTPVTIDLSTNGINWFTASDLKQSLESQLPTFQHQSMKDAIQLLARQAGNVSDVSLRRIISISYCLLEAIQHAIYIDTNDLEESWQNPQFIIDKVQRAPDSRENVVFENMVMAWLAGWSEEHPLTGVTEIHTDTHPFNRLYGNDKKTFDIGKLFRGRFYWQESHAECGLQIADIASTIVFKAVNDLQNVNCSVGVFKILMRSSLFGPARAAGLFSMTNVGSQLSAKYRPLSLAMETVKKGYKLSKYGDIFIPD